MAYPYAITTRADGEILTAAKYNADEQNHIDHNIPEDADDYSVSLAESRLQTDPATLATSLSGELERLRFILARMAQVTNWDQAAALIRKAGDTLTGELAFGGQDATGLDEIALNDAAANPTAAGRLRRNGPTLGYHDGTAARAVATQGGEPMVTAPSPPLANALYRESLVRAWFSADLDGVLSDSYNVTSVVHNSTGKYTITWDRDFANTGYAVMATVGMTGAARTVVFANKLVGSVQIEIYTAAGALADPTFLDVIAIGDQ